MTHCHVRPRPIGLRVQRVLPVKIDTVRPERARRGVAVGRAHVESNGGFQRFNF